MTDQKGQEPVEGTTPDLSTETKPAEETVQTQPVQVEDETQELPDGVSERTREQFEKLKKHNLEMSQKLSKYEQGEQEQKRSALDAFQPQIQAPNNLSPGQVEQIAQSFVDQDGYVDVNAINSELQKASEVARQAAERARQAEEKIATYEHTDQTRRTYEKHPQLDPYSPQFDQKFSDLTRLEILRQMTEEGKQDYLAAANRVKRDFYNPEKLQQDAESQKQKEQQKVQDKRQQATSTVTGNRVQIDPQEQASLVQGTIRGDREATYKRLQASGY